LERVDWALDFRWRASEALDFDGERARLSISMESEALGIGEGRPSIFDRERSSRFSIESEVLSVFFSFFES
jgi:hypothetical protein